MELRIRPLVRPMCGACTAGERAKQRPMRGLGPRHPSPTLGLRCNFGSDHRPGRAPGPQPTRNDPLSATVDSHNAQAHSPLPP